MKLIVCNFIINNRDYITNKCVLTKQLERWLPFMRQQLKHLELFRTNVGKNILVSYNDKIIQFTIKSKFSTCIYCSNFLSIIEMDSLLLILCWVCHKQNILSFNKTNQLNIMICFKDRSQIVSKWDPLQWYFIWCIISKYRHKFCIFIYLEWKWIA